MAKISYKNPNYPTLKLPSTLSFKNTDFVDFNSYLSIFDWDFDGDTLIIDAGYCTNANYQALTLLILYIWHLKRKGVYVSLRFSSHNNNKKTALHSNNLKNMWNRLGGAGCYTVLNNSSENFRSRYDKPLIAIKNPSTDIGKAIDSILQYSQSLNFDLIDGHEETLRYIVLELLYNTTEHGYNPEIPSLLQFNWYRDKNQLSFILADLGVGIKKHLENTYPTFASDVEALELAIKPEISGTFGINQPYQAKNNAGMGLFLSSNIGKLLEADMYIISGHGLMHISPTDTTTNTLRANWPGTFVYMTIGFDKFKSFKFSDELSRLRAQATEEITARNNTIVENEKYFSMSNYFGNRCEVKHEAKNFRDRHIIPAIRENQTIILDFSSIESAPHSFLTALLATPIQMLGLSAYKKIKTPNASPIIRATLDFIFDSYTD